MTEPPASRTESEPGTSRDVEPPGQGYRSDRYDRPNRLNQALVWVGIVAGVVFIVALIFFSGFWIGRSTDHYYSGWNRHQGQMAPGQSSGMTCPAMMGPGGMMGPSTTAQMTPGQMGPGPMRPGMGPGAMTTTPTTPPP